MQTPATFHDIQGKHVFITGGGSGIGAFLTAGFLQQGANVSFVQRHDASDFVTKMEQQYKATPLYLPCDLTKIDQLQQSIEYAQEHFGAIDVLVNNAGNDQRHTLEDYSQQDWDANIAINLRPYFFTAQAVIGDMRRRKQGIIINYSSLSYLIGNTGYPAYVAANAAITGLTRALAREYGGDNIRVNALAPGWVLTQKQLDNWATPEALQHHLDRQCLKEYLQPQDMVAGTLFLASQASRMMTGQVLVIDGGVAVTG